MFRQHTCESLPKSQIAPTPKSTISVPVGIIEKRSREEKRDKAKIGVGTSVTVKVGEIDEKIREGKSRRMRKELVGWM